MANERLAAFLFRLARDNVPFGAIEEQVAVVEQAHLPGQTAEYVGAAELLGDWARHMADRLAPPRALFSSEEDIDQLAIELRERVHAEQQLTGPSVAWESVLPVAREEWRTLARVVAAREAQ